MHARLALACGILWCQAAAAEPLYLCKAYSGGLFWSSAHCSTRQATIDRIVEVPEGMPFEQQVMLGNQAAAEGARLAAPPPAQPHQPVQRSARQRAEDECARLEAHIARLDAMARQPQSAAVQDKLAERRRSARSKQFELRCK
jgi:hypothetical protein